VPGSIFLRSIVPLSHRPARAFFDAGRGTGADATRGALEELDITCGESRPTLKL